MSAADSARLNALSTENDRLRAEVQRFMWANLALASKLETSALRVVALSEKLTARENAAAAPVKAGRFNPSGNRS